MGSSDSEPSQSMVRGSEHEEMAEKVKKLEEQLRVKSRQEGELCNKISSLEYQVQDILQKSSEHKKVLARKDEELMKYIEQRKNIEKGKKSFAEEKAKL